MKIGKSSPGIFLPEPDVPACIVAVTRCAEAVRIVRYRRCH
jgi:hypothetical protein